MSNNDQPEVKQFHIRVDLEAFRKVRIYAAREMISINEAMNILIKVGIDSLEDN